LLPLFNVIESDKRNDLTPFLSQEMRLAFWRKPLDYMVEKYKPATNEVWVIGDCEETAISADNSLGTKTVQILRTGVKKPLKAQFHVSPRQEFLSLVQMS
jgi:FMN phosphatase YigB (HAD superfamily)|tara:strand:+ start:1722 stop:2021 length:300 start_codon:yes stop_codon:yes gene_type:complete